jgi:hypothetical protein
VSFAVLTTEHERDGHYAALSVDDASSGVSQVAIAPDVF